ncbi:MAG: hypothetical protein JW942_04040 [Opitutales bacterium]|nr:hypothetical protein [Opitutales bacterium]
MIDPAVGGLVIGTPDRGLDKRKQMGKIPVTPLGQIYNVFNNNYLSSESPHQKEGQANAIITVGEFSSGGGLQG